jgi:bacterial/archaeal transporter family-2 protein
MQYLYMLLAVIAGAMIPLQTGFNTQLGKVVGNAWSASALVLFVAAIAMTLLAIATRAPLPTIAQTTNAPIIPTCIDHNPRVH